MFYKKVYTSALTTASKLRRNAVNFSKFDPLNSGHIKKSFKSALVVSAAAIGLSLYVIHNKIIVCDVNMNSENEVTNSVTYDEAIEKSRDLLQRVKDEAGIPGLVIGVSFDGETIWEEGFGFADVENRVICSPDTVMRIASISKSITMAAVAKLWEQGKLDLDKPIQEYVPAFPQKSFNSKPVTITCRQLVSHLGGIRHYNNEKCESKKANEKSNNSKESVYKEMELKEYFITARHDCVKSALDIFKDDPLAENPGTKFLYTTYGWTLVSAIVEAVSKEHFTVYIKKMFKVLGMNHTFLEENEVLIYNRSRNYMKSKDGFLMNAPYVDNSYKWAGGGFVSTVGDLLQFANAMLYSLQFKPVASAAGIKSSTSKITENNSNSIQNSSKEQLSGFLNSKTLEVMWKPAPPAVNYGMGWCVQSKMRECNFCAENEFYVYHTGRAIGASSVLLILPPSESNAVEHSNNEVSIPKGIIVAILTNMHDVSLSGTALKIAKTFERTRPLLLK